LAPLFAATSTLELELETDLRRLRRTNREPGFQPGVLRWRVGDASGEVAVGVSPRGRFRRQRENCRFPPLFIEFPANTEGLFAGQDVLPVATQCQAGQARYVVQEYLAYRTYALLTDHSVAVRLARTRYIDASRGGRTLDSYSFLMEHFESMAARVGASLLADSALEPDAFAPRATALVEVFEYLIGNTDWSTVAQHNVAVLRTAAGEIVPVPYDFDFAGVVDAKYAAPSEKLRIRSVRQRLFRGFCRPEQIVRGAIDIVKDRREAITDLYRQTAELDAALVERSLAYYDEFFEIVRSPEALRRNILEPCRR
jgi:hypothetical protein